MSNVDDSVHVMIKHDKKRMAKKGEKPHGYVPRASHPLLDQKNQEEDAGTAGAKESDTNNNNNG